MATIIGTSASEVLSGGSADDIILADTSGGYDTVYGGSGNDVITAGWGVFYGESGNDRIEFANDPSYYGTASFAYGGDGNDVIIIQDVAGASGQVDGGAGNDTLQGGSGDDYLYGGATGSDTVTGGAGNDILQGGAYGGSVLNGGAGDDLLTDSWYGSDTLTGGSGKDTFMVAAVYATYPPPTADIITDFVAGSGGDVIDLDGTILSQLVGYSNGTNPFTAGFFHLNQVGTDTYLQLDWNGPTGGSNYYDLLKLAGVTASELTSDNFVSGYDPQPFQVNKGITAGNNAINAAEETAGVTLGGTERFCVSVSLQIGGTTRAATLSANSWSYTLVEADYAALSQGANTVTVTGTDAQGHLASTHMTFVYDTVAPSASNFALANGDDDGQSATDNITTRTSLRFVGVTEANAHVDLYEDATLVGSATANTEGAWSAAVTLASGHHSLSATTTDAAGNAALTSTTLLVAVAYSGTPGNDTLSGGLGSDLVLGAAGNDRLTGDGSDTLMGDSGDDVYVTASGNDVIAESAGGGADSVLTAAASYTLGANVENLIFTGAGSFTGTGNGLANSIVGGTGNDTLNGGGGNDRLIGGTGDDVYVMANSGASVSEEGNAGTDTLQSAVTVSLTRNVENLTLTGTNAVNGIGNKRDNVLVGNAGNNILSGRGGNDTLIGGAGADTLAGGDGVDLFFYESVAQGSDIIMDFEGGADKVGFYSPNFGALAAGALDTASFVLNGPATQSLATFLFNTSAHTLSFDADGTGAMAAVTIASFGRHVTLSASDIVMVN